MRSFVGFIKLIKALTRLPRAKREVEGYNFVKTFTEAKRESKKQSGPKITASGARGQPVESGLLQSMFKSVDIKRVDKYTPCSNVLTLSRAS